MPDLEGVDWPPKPIATERLTLRDAEPADRAAFVDLLTSPEVRRFLGGALDREEIGRLPTTPSSRPGRFVVDEAGTMIGSVSLDRRDPARPGRPQGAPDSGSVELSYELLASRWGRGLAFEACTAALRWLGRALPGEPVVVCTQTANMASTRLAQRLGFIEVDRFEEFGAEQWFGVLRLP